MLKLRHAALAECQEDNDGSCRTVGNGDTQGIRRDHYVYWPRDFRPRHHTGRSQLVLSMGGEG